MNTIASKLETAIVFLTNKVDRPVMDRLREIHNQTNDISNCYVLLDASTLDIEQTWKSYCREYNLENVQLVQFKIMEIARELSVKLFAPGQLVPGSTHLPLLWLALKSRHRFYWLVEDDVVFTGDWGGLIAGIEVNKSDLLCSHIANYKDIPNWTWWPTLKAPAAAIQSSNPLAMITKAFFPIYRISARALFKLLDSQRSGWSGHFEVLIPTLLKYAGYSIAELNSVSPSPVYSAGRIKKDEGSGELSSLRFRPSVSWEEIQSSTTPAIFHPVKVQSDEVP